MRYPFYRIYFRWESLTIRELYGNQGSTKLCKDGFTSEESERLNSMFLAEEPEKRCSLLTSRDEPPTVPPGAPEPPRAGSIESARALHVVIKLETKIKPMPRTLIEKRLIVIFLYFVLQNGKQDPSGSRNAMTNSKDMT